MTQKEAQTKLHELTNQFERTDKPGSIEDMIDTLRVYIKYTLLDNECLKRENKFLRSSLNDSN